MKETPKLTQIELSLIRSYLKNYMEDKERLIFEQRMRDDPELNYNVGVFRVMMRALLLA